ncbi:hypothetical protein DL93DRAFT_2170678 [Clavulina sp. PMI_390]|nr:hypothetical protein DL93DRAFT_2170678 [Clavulina sp. PMI_390]
MSSVHNLLLLSKKLQERIERFGSIPQPRQLPQGATLSRVPTLPSEGSEGLGQGKEILADDLTLDELSALQTVVEEELVSYDLAKWDDLPLSLSIRLINLFLPFRSHYYFLIDLSRFGHSLPLPPSHPESIHPCLLNACYLAACACNRGGLSPFIPHFLDRTRHFLQQSLMYADRIPHFMWANIIMAAFFVKDRRMLEAMTTAGTVTRLALACGLGLPSDSASGIDESTVDEYLLPPPKDQVEADDRIRLAHSIYTGTQGLPHLGFPASYPFEDWWSPISQEVSFDTQDGKASVPKEKLWRLEVYLKVLVTNTFERVKTFTRSIVANGHLGREEEYLSIETQIRVQRESFRSLYDPQRLRGFEASTPFDINIVLGYATLYGSGLVLHSLWAAHDPAARPKMLECLQGLVNICTHTKNSKRPHLGLISIVHMMNAVRLIAHELKRSTVKKDATLSVSYCVAIGSLLDFLDDTMVFFPAWVDVLSALRSTLTSAATSLSS